MMNSILSWLQANAAWLQVVTAIVQSVAALIAIYVALRAADRSARLAFELSQGKESANLQDQLGLLRFTLGLEIERNIEDLRRFYDDFTVGLLEEQGTNDETPELREARQRCIALNMPDLSYRFWHSQQLSSLLPLALTRGQIREVNRIYSDFDRLSKISRVFGAEALWRSKAPFRHSGETAVEGAVLSSSVNELGKLLDEFELSLRDVLTKVNPLEAVIEVGDEDRYVSEGIDKTRTALQTANEGSR
jgi:hypothetical protein